MAAVCGVRAAAIAAAAAAWGWGVGQRKGVKGGVGHRGCHTGGVWRMGRHDNRCTCLCLASVPRYIARFTLSLWEALFSTHVGDEWHCLGTEH